jgi:hypothetical protein
MVRLPLGVFMRFRFAILILLVTASASADVVTLKTGRTLRAVAVVTHGAESTLTLTSGGTMSVPASSIESIRPELIATDICAASPYRCQDRATLMMRRAQAAQHTTAKHPAN